MDRDTVIGLLLIAVLTMGLLYFENSRRAASNKAAEQQAAQFAAQPTAGIMKSPTPEAPELQPTSVGREPVPSNPAAPPTSPTPPPSPAAPVNEWPMMAVSGQEYEIRPQGDNGNYALTFTSVGGDLKKVVLLKYLNDAKSLVTLDECAEGRSLMMLDPKDRAGLPLSAVNYDIVSQDNSHIEFRHKFANGLEVTKRFDFPEGAYHILLKVTLRNTTEMPLSQRYELTGGVRVVPESSADQRNLGAMIATREDQQIKVSRETPSDLYKKENGVHTPRDFPVTNTSQFPIVWAGTTDKYFAVLLAPMPPSGADSTAWIESARLRILFGSETDPKSNAHYDNAAASMITKEITIGAHGQASHDYMLFVGPKDMSLFASPQHTEYKTFAGVINYGWFEFISIPLLWLLGLFHKIIPNYGVGIILLTIVVRVLVHPLTKKSQVSMYRMQKLAPEIKKLQEKYKHDKQRLGREQMEMFKTHGVNPMSGCWPMLLQFPILIGLYRALDLSINLRGAPFVFWIHDLSRPDTINPHGGFPINILPIAMVVSWIVQQRMMPKPPDPQQRRQQAIMSIMTTVMFAFIFYSVASGLTLYWFVSTMIGIGEQKIIQRHIKQVDAEREAKAAGK